MSETLAKFRRLRSLKIPFVFLIHLTFLFIGVATTLLGVILPALANRFGLDDAVSGNLFTAHFAGSLAGTFWGERLWQRFGFSVTIVVGLLVMSTAIFGIGSAYFNWLVLSLFLNGFGIGLTIPATNLLVSALNPQRAAAALNILNFTWSGGALLCPAFVGLLTVSFDIWLPLMVLASLLLFLAFALAIFARRESVVVDSGKQISGFKQNVWQTPFAFLIAALLFFCVGAENSLSGWLTAFSLRLQNDNSSLLTISATVFWLAFLLGRLFAPFFLGRVAENKFILISLITGAFGAVLLLIPAPNFLPLNFPILIGTALAGFGLAPIFPTLFAQFTNRFGETGQTKWLFVSSTLGGAFFTALVGYFSTLSGSLRSGLTTTFVCFLMMIVLQSFLTFKNCLSQSSH